MTESTCDLLSLVVAGGMVSAGCDDSSLLDAPRGSEATSEAFVSEERWETPVSCAPCPRTSERDREASTQCAADFAHSDEPACVGDGRPFPGLRGAHPHTGSSSSRLSCTPRG